MSGSYYSPEARAERFWIKVDMSGGPDACWPWLGYIDPDGYGKVTAGRKGVTTTVQRIAYELSIGAIPDGREIDHLCRSRSCANPSHLEPVTHQINVLRGQNHAAMNARMTHCKNGHEFTEENTYVWNRHRYCKACRRSKCP